MIGISFIVGLCFGVIFTTVFTIIVLRKYNAGLITIHKPIEEGEKNRWTFAFSKNPEELYDQSVVIFSLKVES